MKKLKYLFLAKLSKNEIYYLYANFVLSRGPSKVLSNMAKSYYFDSCIEFSKMCVCIIRFGLNLREYRTIFSQLGQDLKIDALSSILKRNIKLRLIQHTAIDASHHIEN